MTCITPETDKKMTFFVRYKIGPYDGFREEEFETAQEVVDFLKQHESNPDFTFEVIEGRRVLIRA